MKKFFCPVRISQYCKNKQRGFTLIELLIVTGIIGIILGIGIAQYVRFNRLQILDQATQNLKSNLRFAQNLALSGEKPSSCQEEGQEKVLDGYRVRFFSGGGSEDFYQIEPVCEGEAGEVIRTFKLPQNIRFNPLPSPSQVLFKVLGQGTDLGSELTITLQGFGAQKTVTITKVGKIE